MTHREALLFPKHPIRICTKSSVANCDNFNKFHCKIGKISVLAKENLEISHFTVQKFGLF